MTLLHMQTILKSGSVVTDATSGSIKCTNIKGRVPKFYYFESDS